MITATDLELTAGGRQLLEPVTFQVAPGDRIGLVGRNGAGKTTLARVLAGESLPAAGSVRRSTPVAYLPQDPRTGDLSVLARDRILGARGLDAILRDMQTARAAMGRGDTDHQNSVLGRYSRLEEEFHVLGGWAAEAEAGSIASSLGLPDRVLTQPLGTLSGGQRRRVEAIDQPRLRPPTRRGRGTPPRGVSSGRGRCFGGQCSPQHALHVAQDDVEAPCAEDAVTASTLRSPVRCRGR